VAPLRIEQVDGIYHVNGKAVDGVKLFRDEVDRVRFLELLIEQASLSEWCILGYCLMTTHYHLILQLRELTLSSGFQRMNSLYARRYNKRHDRRGALWQRRFFDSIVETDGHLCETIRYVALNPVRASMCATPEDWPWSNYASSIGVAVPDFVVDERELLRLFGTRRDRARKTLRAFVEEADPRVRRSQTRV
jgi:putative transposase